MNCQQAKQLMDACADRELDAAAVLELEQHLQSCASCALVWRNLQTLKKSLKQDALHFKAPAELRQRIKAELPSPAEAVPQWRTWRWSWLAAATSGAFAACVASLLIFTLTRPSSQQQLAREIVSSHVRSLMADHVTDVASTDQHTVKPWFAGKLDFSPPVKDLTAQEFPLIGGRLDYVDGRSVAALVFQRNKHIINLFVWPADKADAKATPVAPIQGYNAIRWVKGGMVFWAVSDLNEKELMGFAQNFSADVPAP
jgi:anti-sigma factor RsiW